MGFKENTKFPSQRQLRVGEQIRHALSEVFIFENFYTADGNTHSITVSEVRVSPDLKNATAYVMPLGGIVPDGFINGLNEQAYHFRKMVNKKLSLKYSPKIVFKLDNSFEVAGRVGQLLKKSEDDLSAE